MNIKLNYKLNKGNLSPGRNNGKTKALAKELIKESLIQKGYTKSIAEKIISNYLN